MFTYELTYTNKNNPSFVKSERGYKTIEVKTLVPSADVAIATAKFLLGDYKNNKKISHIFVSKMIGENGENLFFTPVDEIKYDLS